MSGLILKGTLVASTIKSGVRTDDGKPYARRVSAITTGEGVINWNQTVDPSTSPKPHPLMKEVTVTNITYTNTNHGIITINGEGEIAK